MKKAETRKLTDEEKYILKAAKLKGLAAVEIDGLKRHFTGEAPNEFVVRRNPDLFELLEKKKKEKQGFIRETDNPYIDMDNVLVSRIDIYHPGTRRIVTPSLTSYITKPATYVKENSKFHELSIKNELFLPFVAKAFDVSTLTFMTVAVENDELEGDEVQHVTKNFIGTSDKFIPGYKILTSGNKKDSGKSLPKKIGMSFLLDKTDKYIKKLGKKLKVPEESLKAKRGEIRRELIRQTFINKLLLNDNESNGNWGIILHEDGMSLSPMFGFEYCAGVMDLRELPTRRVVGNIGKLGGREDIQSFMITYGKEEWFRTWVTEALSRFDIERAFEAAETKANVEFSEQEKDYYRAVLDKTFSLAREVVDVDFDESKFGRLSLFKNRPSKIRQNIDRDDSISFK